MDGLPELFDLAAIGRRRVVDGCRGLLHALHRYGGNAHVPGDSLHSFPVSFVCRNCRRGFGSRVVDCLPSEKRLKAGHTPPCGCLCGDGLRYRRNALYRNGGGTIRGNTFGIAEESLSQPHPQGERIDRQAHRLTVRRRNPYFIPISSSILGFASSTATRLWQTEQSFVTLAPDLLVCAPS
jgi:hypothetical protein